jgi:hypothetical protein
MVGESYESDRVRSKCRVAVTRLLLERRPTGKLQINTFTLPFPNAH